jgi:hypothetical protein
MINWKEVQQEFNLILAKNLYKKLLHIDLTYEYIEDFIAFAKNKNEKICMTAISKYTYLWAARLDIHQCLRQYKESHTFPIYWIHYKFSKNYKCKHGDDFKNVYLVFVADNEKQIIDLLDRFNKLKAFI